MLEKNMGVRKLIAGLLIFCLMFSHCFSLATFLGDSADEEDVSSNMEMSVYISSDTAEKSVSYVANTGEENLFLNIELKVLEGYVKDPVLTIDDLENELFEIDTNSLNSEYIESIDDNKITISRLDAGNDITVQIPIKLKEQSSYNPDKISSEIQIELSGTYVDLDLNHFSISKYAVATLSFDSNMGINITSDVEKSFSYTENDVQYILAQYSIYVEQTEDVICLPVKSTTIEFSLPENDDLIATGVAVDRAYTEFTGEVANFDENSWSYNSENKSISISVLNQAIDENNNYAIPNGQDKFVVTVVYEVNGENLELASTISSAVEIYSGLSNKVVEASIVANYDLSQGAGKLVTYALVSQSEVSKGDIYANYNLTEDYYETLYSNVISVNVSKPEYVNSITISDADEYFVDSDGVRYETQIEETNSIYYKTTTLNKENLDNILGEEGVFKILNESGDELLQINKDQEADENGEIVIMYSGEIGKLIFEIENPEGEGILNITNEKAVGNLQYNKETAMKLDKIVQSYNAVATYDGETKDELGTITNEITLTKTTTNATVSIEKTTISALAQNQDIDLKIALNNYSTDADLYKDPVFEITFPKEVEKVSINDMNIIYGNNEFTFSNVETYNNNEGNIVIRIALSGTQTLYSMAEVVAGTNIILNVDIDVNKYTTSKTEKITMKYYNESATEYENAIDWSMDTSKNDDIIVNQNGYSETDLSFVTLSGVISSQSLTGYNEGSELYSISQGDKTDRILTNVETKTVTSDIVVMNNTDEQISDVSILGRFAFAGNTNISTGEDLGTTIDTRMLSIIEQTGEINKDVNIYYSANGYATKELDNEENGWTQDLSSFESTDLVKSYLIVVNDTLEAKESISFSYKFELPENLQCDTSVYLPFATYYKNINSEEQISEASLLGLKTVSSPKLNVSIVSNAGDTVTEGQIIDYTVTIKNVGEEPAEDVVITLDIPENTTYVEYVEPTEDEEGYYERKEDVININVEVGDLEAGEEKIYTFSAQVNPDSESISSATVSATAEGVEEETETNEEENPEEEEKPEEGEEEKPEEDNTTEEEPVEDDDEEENNDEEDVQLEDSTDEVSVEVQDLTVTLTGNYSNMIVREEKDITYSIVVSNNTKKSRGITGIIYNGTYYDYDEYYEKRANGEIESSTDESTPDDIEFVYGATLTNTVVTQVIPEGIEFVSATVSGFDEDPGTYDSATRTYTFVINEFEVNKSYSIQINTTTAKLETETKKTIGLYTSVSSDDIDTVVSDTFYTTIGRPNIETTFTSDADNSYITEKESVTYTLKVKNTGSVSAESLVISDYLPTELKGSSGTYYFESDKNTVRSVDINSSNQYKFTVTLDIDDTLVAKLKATANEIDGNESSAENQATVTSGSLIDEKTDTIDIKIQKATNTSSSSTDNSKRTVAATTSNVSKTASSSSTSYKITGKAWKDSNKNGKRDSGESFIANVTARLYDASSNELISSAVTDSSGDYVFNGLENGKFYIIFTYDTSKYTLTTYQAEDVDSAKNSDAILTNSLAITDIITISSSSVGNIDIGLVESSMFDLSLGKSITKVTVVTTSGTTAYDFDNVTTAKVDIKSKELSGAKVYMEYNITVYNKGEVSGVVNGIVDYLPEGTSFDQDSNDGWYQNENGYLINDSLANEELAPGESRTVTLILSKNMTTENTGIVSNISEIAASYNTSGAEDVDSTPGNGVYGEDDMSTADIVISVNTGGSLVNVSLIIVIAILALIAIYVVKKNVLTKVRRW